MRQLIRVQVPAWAPLLPSPDVHRACGRARRYHRHIGRLAQLARAPRLHRGGHKFESCTAHNKQPRNAAVFISPINPRFCSRMVLVFKQYVKLCLGGFTFLFAENDICIRKSTDGKQIASIDIDSGSVLSGRLTGLGLFLEKDDPEHPEIRMRSMTVSREEIFPRDLGLVTFGI